MGIIDRIWFKFTCPKCGKSEATSVNDTGSTFGGWDWGSVKSTDSFTVVSRGGGKVDPEVNGAMCNDCQVDAEVDWQYGLTRPKDW